eukprot:GGOE01024137.1.p1 GENE.GGOE01024137.1~~GGOE01024137.1.p1  ORF type:complete len:283 (-),score=53.46 GGOE01024137.1:70-918(-)
MHSELTFGQCPLRQPYTSLGHGRDADDARSSPLHHLLSLFPKLENKPQLLVLENVPEFDGSRSQAALLQALEQCNYAWHHVHFCPTQLNIPNERRRYFLFAAHGPRFQIQSAASAAGVELPSKLDSEEISAVEFKKERAVATLARYLQVGCRTTFSAVPEAFFQKHPTYRFDVVQPTSTRSACVTKGYMKSHRGTGSLVQDDHLDTPLHFPCGRELLGSHISLRFFTPRELLNLHGFPASFAFPQSLSPAQCCALVGNSLNINVVAHLLSQFVVDALSESKQ